MRTLLFLLLMAAPATAHPKMFADTRGRLYFGYRVGYANNVVYTRAERVKKVVTPKYKNGKYRILEIRNGRDAKYNTTIYN